MSRRLFVLVSSAAFAGASLISTAIVAAPVVYIS
jgi:hypothetical protein